MSDWFFPSRGYGATECSANPALEMFKGEPIRAMAREICQNSLDANKNNAVIQYEKQIKSTFYYSYYHKKHMAKVVKVVEQ